MNIGIDLGTTYSCIGVYQDNIVNILLNDNGDKTTKSIVSFVDDDIVVGDICSDNYIYDSKRMLGKGINDPHIKANMKHWPFSLSDNNGKIIINNKYTPIEISSHILSYMKTIAQNYSNEQIINAVITVPAYFNDMQRSETIKAGELAGIYVRRLINEPTAAAIAYGLDKIDGESHILVFDLGGGTFDISILRIDNGLFEVISTGGDCNLGGQDINYELVIYCIKQFKKANKNIDIKKIMFNKKILHKLNNACEKAKKVLSTSNTANITVDALYDGIDFCISISRTKFEYICSKFFSKCMNIVEDVLKNSELDKELIEHIVLVGGSTRIPKIYDMLEQYFNKKPKKDINPDEAVAYGAAIHSASLAGNKNLKDIILVDVTPLSLGIKTHGDIMTNIIKRNTPIPCTKTKIFTTYTDNQPSITVNVYEGERRLAKYNNFLGAFTLLGISPMLRGLPKVNISFHVDHNGILTVQGSEDSSGIKKNITICANKDRLSEQEMHDLIMDGEVNKKNDKIIKDKIKAKTELISYINNAKILLEDELIKQTKTEKEIEEINNVIINTIIWNNSHDIYELDSKDYKDKIKEIEDIIYKICMYNN